jgi:hypothetical protein
MPITEENKYDLRVVQRYIKRTLISAADYEKYLATLEDTAADAAQTETRFVPTYENRHYRS